MPLTVLSERQQLELNKAVLQYLESRIDASQLTAIRQALRLPQDTEPVVQDYLEKKWLTVLRLQRKILDLESEVLHLKQMMATLGLLEQMTLLKDKINWLPQVLTKEFMTPDSQAVNLVAIHPILPQVTAGLADGLLVTWNLVNDELAIPDKVIRAHTRAVNTVKWLAAAIEFPKRPKTYVFALASADLSIKIWDGTTYANVRTLTGHEHTVLLVAWLQRKPEILYLVLRDKTVKVWDVINGYCIKLFIGHLEWVRDVDVVLLDTDLLFQLEKLPPSELGDFLLTCSNDHLVRLSHADLGLGVALLIGHTHVVETVKFFPRLAHIYLDKFVKDNLGLFPTILPELVDSPVYTKELGFKYCVLGGRDNSIKVWLIPPPVLVPHRPPQPAKTNNSQGWLLAELNDHTLWVKDIAIHPLGRFFFTASDDKSIKVWDLAALNVGGRIRCVRTLQTHQGFINTLDFARVNVDVNKINPEHDPRDEVVKQVELKMRCLFALGGVDNLVKLWS